MSNKGDCKCNYEVYHEQNEKTQGAARLKANRPRKKSEHFFNLAVGPRKQLSRACFSRNQRTRGHSFKVNTRTAFSRIKEENLEKRFLSIREASKWSSLSSRFLYEKCQKRVLRFYRVGRRIVIDFQDLREFIEKGLIEKVDDWGEKLGLK